MQFGTDGAAAKISSDMNLGTLTPSSTGMKVEVDAKISESIKTETKDEVKATGEFNPETMRQELKNTIKETLEKKNMGTVADGKIIIEVKNEQSTNATNRIEITINESSNSQEESIKFDKVEIVQETKKINGTIEIAKVAVPVTAATTVADNVKVVTAVVTETKTVIQNATSQTNVMETVKTSVETKAKEVAPTVTITVTKEEAKTVTFTLAEQTSFRQYIDKVKSTYSEYYGEFQSTVDGKTLKFTRTNIKEHDSIKLGTTVTEEVTKEGTYTYKIGTETKTGSTLASVLPVTLPTLKPVELFNLEAQNAFKAYVDKIKADYSEFYRVDSTEITAYKLVLKRTNLKAHDDVAKNTVITEEITKNASGFTYTKTLGITKTTTTNANATALVPTSIPTLVAKNAFLKAELTKYNEYFNNLKTKQAGFYKDFVINATEEKVTITRVATKNHDNIIVGDKVAIVIGNKITEEFAKVNNEYKYIYKVGDIVKKIGEPKATIIIPVVAELKESEKVWNITKTDLNTKTSNLDELYTKVTNLKTKSNSEAMNYLFQAILATKPLEAELRDEILKILSGKIPTGGNEYDYASKLFTPADTYKVLTGTGLKAIRVVAENLQKAYETGETIKLSTEMTDGYNIILTPAHFKAISGLFKVYSAQLHLIGSYKFANNNDLVVFLDFIEELEKTGDVNINFMRDKFPTLDVMNVDTTLQNYALTHMRQGTKEMLDSAKALPVTVTKPTKASANYLSITSTDKTKIVDGLELTNGMLVDGGKLVDISIDGKKYQVKIDLSKLYTLDLKALTSELLKGTTRSQTVEESKVVITTNVNNSTFGGILPNKLPKELQAK